MHRCDNDDGPYWDFGIVYSFDPNELQSLDGFSSEHWVAASKKIDYTILFENDPKLASAAAQKVTLYFPAPSKENLFSWRLGSYGFKGLVINVPPNLSSYSTRLDVRDSMGIFVDVLAGIDITENRAFWIFQSIPKPDFHLLIPILEAISDFAHISAVRRRDEVGIQAFPQLSCQEDWPKPRTAR